jgi:uncharacterized phage protein gp47/JayE
MDEQSLIIPYSEILSAMQTRYRELAGFDADDASDIGIRLKVLAAEVAKAYERARALRDQVFAQTATGLYLERHAETRGLRRKAAVAAEGTLRFRREVPSLSDITVPAGVVVATRSTPQRRFETTEPVVLPAGETEVLAPARAVMGGRESNVAVGAVTVLITGAPGLSAADNPTPFAGGVDEEGDDALRARLLESYRHISNGANTAFYYDVAMGKDGVESANILPRSRGRGTVDVVIEAADGVKDAILTDLAALYAVQKEINVEVAVLGATRVSCGFPLELEPESGHSYEVVEAAVEAAITAFVGGLAVGAPLLLSRLGASILAAEGVANYKITAPTADVHPAGTQVLRPGSITITRMITG